MAYAVTVSAGLSKVTVRFPTPEQALAKAQDAIEYGEKNVTIYVAATGDEFSIDEFAAKLSASHPS